MFSSIFLVVILSNIRNIDIDAKEDGKTLLQLLDAFRNECKVCIIHYNVGYDAEFPQNTNEIMLYNKINK